jgi:hypothetical protein
MVRRSSPSIGGGYGPTAQRQTCPRQRGEVVRRIVHDGEPAYSVVEVVGILAESKTSTAYWRNTKKRLLQDEGAS